MKINKDLTEACLMLGFICLVLIGTTEFENQTTKEILIGALTAASLLFTWLRIKAGKEQEKEPDRFSDGQQA